MSRRCILCTSVEEVHPEVGVGYTPHPFEDARMIRSAAYTGIDRRSLIRRMDDRVAAIERVMARLEERPEMPERRQGDRRAS